jgi:hypothetical protein
MCLPQRNTRADACARLNEARASARLCACARLNETHGQNEAIRSKWHAVRRVNKSRRYHGPARDLPKEPREVCVCVCVCVCVHLDTCCLPLTRKQRRLPNAFSQPANPNANPNANPDPKPQVSNDIVERLLKLAHSGVLTAPEDVASVKHPISDAISSHDADNRRVDKQVSPPLPLPLPPYPNLPPSLAPLLLSSLLSQSPRRRDPCCPISPR